MNQTKLVFSVFLLILVIVFAIQNMANVNISFLIWDFPVRRSAMVFTLLMIGVVLGWFWRGQNR